MGSDASVTVVPSPGTPDAGRALAASGAERLHLLEQRWSRFRASSEVSGLNRAAGEPRTTSRDTVRLVEALVRAWHATRGAFDPTLLATLVELGYAASRDDAELRTSLAAAMRPTGQPDLILVDAEASSIQLPIGTTIDPGGLGKGLAADIVVEELLDAGALGALVEVGGDIRATGEPPDGGAWNVSITPVFPGDAPATVRFRDGGIATSSSRIRTWTRRGRHLHHLIDPQTRQPTRSDVVAATVIAGTAAWAEAFTKVALVDGLDRSLATYDRLSLAAAVRTSDGAFHTSRPWSGFRS